MSVYAARRIGLSLLTLGVILAGVFICLRVLPGDPVQLVLGEFATPEAERALRHKMGLDQPLYVQFARFISSVVSGDLGISLRNEIPVSSIVIQNFPYTVVLTVSGAALALAMGVPLGVACASKQGTRLDETLTAAGVIVGSVPTFWLGVLFLYLFSARLGLFPAIGGGMLSSIKSVAHHAVLPASVVGLREAAFVMRMTRTCLAETLRADYVRTARAKGLPERVVVYRHALRPALVPVVTAIGLIIARLVTGSVVVETVFSRPGLGKALVDAILARDYVVVQGLVVVIAVSLVAVNLLTDVTYGLLDPRMR